MSAQANRPLIIKRKKVSGGDGHHGGAWKVAYADFVTAMMAFFMLMWLLNATTEQQRKGIADYFAPSIPLSRVSGGGDGVFGGNMLMEDEAAHDGVGGRDGADLPATLAVEGEGGETPEVAALREIEEQLVGIGGESLLDEQALRHVVTRLTDEGLVIEIFSLPGEPIFEDGGSEPAEVTRRVLQVIGRVADMVVNPVAVGGHLSLRPVVVADNPVWDVSHQRADAARAILETAGLAPARMERVAAHADRRPVTPDPTEARNERLEITLLRTGR